MTPHPSLLGLHFVLSVRTAVHPEPEPVYELSIGFAATESVILGWTWNNPSGSHGTVYEIQRRFGNDAFRFIEVAGEGSFGGSSTPRGPSSPVHGPGKTHVPVAPFLVNFGSGAASGGGMTVTALNADGSSGECRLASRDGRRRFDRKPHR